MTVFSRVTGFAMVVLAAMAAWQSSALGLDVEELVLHPAPQAASPYRLLPSLGEQTPGVAAPLYAQAFLAIQERKVDETVWANLQEKWPNASLDELPREEMRKALAVLRPVLDCVDEAARRPRYGLDLSPQDYSRVLPTLYPQLTAFRVIARLLVVRCRLQILDGDFDGAVRSLKTGYAMARHCAEPPTMLHILMGVTLTEIMNHQVRLVVQMPRAPNLYWAVTAMPERVGDLQAVADFDTLVFQATFPEYERAKSAGATPEEWWTMLDKLAALRPWNQASNAAQGKRGGVASSPEARRKQLEADIPKAIPAARMVLRLRQPGTTEASLDKMSPAEVAVRAALETFQACRDEVAQWSHVPYWQAQPVVDRLWGVLLCVPGKGGFPWERALEPAAALMISARCQRDLAGLRCLEAIRLYAAARGKLPQSLEDITEVPIPVNPLTGKPFPYRAEERYVILELDGHPVKYQWWIRLAD